MAVPENEYPVKQVNDTDAPSLAEGAESRPNAGGDSSGQGEEKQPTKATDQLPEFRHRRVWLPTRVKPELHESVLGVPIAAVLGAHTPFGVGGLLSEHDAAANANMQHNVKRESASMN